MELILIAAMTKDNQVIGYQQRIPWHIPEDLAHFKASTMGHPVIIGRLTYQSLNCPLPGRRMIVLSKDADIQLYPNDVHASSFAHALCLSQGASKVFVAGGAQVYQAALPLADTLLLTVIDQRYEGDTFFPDFSTLSFVLDSKKILSATASVTLCTYRRKPGF